VFVAVFALIVVAIAAEDNSGKVGKMN